MARATQTSVDAAVSVQLSQLACSSDDREWLGHVLRHSFVLPESGSFAGLMLALDQKAGAQTSDNAALEEPDASV